MILNVKLTALVIVNQPVRLMTSWQVQWQMRHVTTWQTILCT